jgi:hypothetical protein
MSNKKSLLPHSPDIERFVLGAVLLDNAVYGRAAAVLTPEDFFLDSPGKSSDAWEIWRAPGAH